jgi:hypothetical protein
MCILISDKKEFNKRKVSFNVNYFSLLKAANTIDFIVAFVTECAQLKNLITYGATKVTCQYTDFYTGTPWANNSK